MKIDELGQRLELAILACRSAGEALKTLRGRRVLTRTVGDQLKSVADFASEAWITSMINVNFPNEPILSEERYEREKKFKASKSGFWILDALDGTKSFHSGFEGFCVQVAFVLDNKVEMGVIYQPVGETVYWGIRNGGSYKATIKGEKKLSVEDARNTYVESTPASGRVKQILNKVHVDKFLEYGSYGLKICKVAEGASDVFLKESLYKIWDVAPGDLIVTEAGGRLTTWDGAPISYDCKKIYFENLLVASKKNHEMFLREIVKYNS